MAKQAKKEDPSKQAEVEQVKKEVALQKKHKRHHHHHKHHVEDDEDEITQQTPSLA